MTKEEIQDEMYVCAKVQFKYYYPNETILDNSISVGNIYESANGYHCQIRFLKNGVIIKCTYNKKTACYTSDFYELKHTNELCWATNRKTGELAFVMTEDLANEHRKD